MSKNLFDLGGKVALVTGGSRGLGLQMVRAFAEHGADVIIVSCKHDACEAVAEEARERADNALGRPGRPEEVVTTALCLASPASSYTTGALIRVDGGHA